MTRPTADVHAMLLPFWRGTVVYRVVALAFALGNAARYGPSYARPAIGVAVVAAMVVWTAFSSRRYLRDGDRRVAAADLVVTAAATASTLVVEDPARLAAGGPVITTVWSAGAVLAVAVAWGTRGGLVAALVTIGILAAVRRVLDGDFLYDVQLLLVVGLAVGFAADAMRRSAVRLQEAVATEAALAERERLARDIHDGVLQVLAYVRRRGRAAGSGSGGAERGDLAEISRLAGEQEDALRRLITSGPSGPGRDRPGPAADLATVLGGVLPARASLAVPAEPVTVPATTAEALAAVVREAAANADEHAGARAGLWVLVEDAPEAVTVSVRDDGPGIPEGRLDEAEAAGHLGVVSSIRARVAELGGTIDLHTAPGEGTEWEIRVPRAAGGGR